VVVHGLTHVFNPTAPGFRVASGWYYLPYSFAAALVVCALALRARGSGWLESRPMRFVGRVSYPLYLTHPLGLAAAAMVVAPGGLLPADAGARDAAEAARWRLGAERVALLPSRGVRWGSGLEPPPHLVGERARALDVLAAGGLICASAAALAELVPPGEARPEPITVSRGEAPGLDALAERLALAGYERVDRV